jgi:nucleoside-triphosphatase
MPRDAPRILLTGAPRAGKTTLVRRIADELAISETAIEGFTTGELLEDGHRVGFLAEGIGGGSGVLAHVARASGPVVGRYRVDVPAFERIALPALERAARGCSVAVIDEIGQMELYSDAFVDAVRRIFEQDVALVATVQARAHPVTDEPVQPECSISPRCQRNPAFLQQVICTSGAVAWRRSQSARR